MGQPVIVANDLGIRFRRNRAKQKRKLKTLLVHGSKAPRSDEFWVFRHVTFTVNEGDAVAVVGANGTGKSTLLRLIAGVLLPDEGQVDVRGEVAPMIELTAGFQADLTGRDNVYLMAGLHGRSRPWVDRRFDRIVDFAGVRDFIDTPFRHYSSGMKVRLGFAVVTELDEPIVLVDEALAVGDKRFKRKCYNRMEKLISDGRTLFLVSHSEADINRFCNRALYLRDGALAMSGSVDEVLEQYNIDQGTVPDDRAAVGE